MLAFGGGGGSIEYAMGRPPDTAMVLATSCAWYETPRGTVVPIVALCLRALHGIA